MLLLACAVSADLILHSSTWIYVSSKGFMYPDRMIRWVESAPPSSMRLWNWNLPASNTGCVKHRPVLRLEDHRIGADKICYSTGIQIVGGKNPSVYYIWRALFQNAISANRKIEVLEKQLFINVYAYIWGQFHICSFPKPDPISFALA